MIDNLNLVRLCYKYPKEILTQSSEEFKLLAVRNNPFFIVYIEEPSNQMQLEAVRRNSQFVRFIKNQSDEVKIHILKNASFCIRYLNEVSDELWIKALSKNGFLISNLTNPDKKIQKIAFDAIMVSCNLTIPIGFINSFCKKFQIALLSKFPMSISSIKKPTKKHYIASIRSQPNIIFNIKPQKKYMQETAVKQDGCSIKHVVNPSKEIQLEAVKQNGLALAFIHGWLYPEQSKERANLKPDDIPEEIKLAAVKQNGLSIKNLSSPSKEIQLEAMKQNPIAAQHIENPCKEVKVQFIETLQSLNFFNMNSELSPLWGHIGYHSNLSLTDIKVTDYPNDVTEDPLDIPSNFGVRFTVPGYFPNTANMSGTIDRMRVVSSSD